MEGKEKKVVFKRYAEKGDAEITQKLLADNNIESEIIVPIPQPADHYANILLGNKGNDFENNIELIINNSDFEKATTILETNTDLLVSKIDTDYYLYGFSNEELIEVLVKLDEWSEYDYALSKLILRERNYNFDKLNLNKLKKDRLSYIEKPQEIGREKKIYGYSITVLSGILSILLEPFIILCTLSIIIGVIIWGSKKVLSNGNIVYRYSLKSRIYARNLIYIGLFSFIISVLLFLQSLT